MPVSDKSTTNAKSTSIKHSKQENYHHGQDINHHLSLVNAITNSQPDNRTSRSTRHNIRTMHEIMSDRRL